MISTRRKLLYASLIVAGFCGVVEGVARFIWWRLERASLQVHYQKGEAILNNDAINYMKVADGVYGYQLKPGFRNENQTINSQSFHQKNEIPIERTPGTLRIVCLGESTTFGNADNLNYPTFLDGILATQATGYRHYEVINAGVPGWISDQVALRVHHQIARFKPDVAILYIGWNDFQSYGPRFPVARESTFALGFGRTPWRRYASSASKAVALLGAWYERPRPEPTPDDYAEALAHSTPPALRYQFLLRSLDQIEQDLRSANPAIRIFVCTLVGLWPQGTPEAWTKMASPWWVLHDKSTPAQTAATVEELNDQLRGFARRHRTDLIDLAGIFGPLDRTRLQWDFAHMYRDGYELMAWSLFDALRASSVVGARDTARYRELLATYQAPPAAADAKH